MTLQLLHGDCLELMKTLPDKSVDLFLCDLPYGCLTQANGKPKGTIYPVQEGTNLVGKLKHIGGCAWDVKIDLVAFWVQVKRLARDDHTPVLHFCNTKFGVELINSNPAWFRYDLVWHKTYAVGFLQANKMPLRSHENIYVFAKKGANYTRIDIDVDMPAYKKAADTMATGRVYNPHTHVERSNVEGKRCPTSVLTFAKGGWRGKHPTQKPDDLYKWLIERYSKEGDMILDATAGSFASCFTAQALGRNAIGMEMNDEFYEKAKAKAEANAGSGS